MNNTCYVEKKVKLHGNEIIGLAGFLSRLLLITQIKVPDSLFPPAHFLHFVNYTECTTLTA